jgi:uncharacterized protein (TIGR03435 family)
MTLPGAVVSGEWEDAMTEWLSTMGPAVANHLRQSTAFAVVAGLLTLALRKNQARARYWVWMAASMKFLLPFALLAAIGSHLVRPRAVPPPAQRTMYFAVEDFSEPFVEMQGTGIREQGTEESSPLSVLSSLKERAWCGAVAVVVWGIGFVTILVAWAVRWRRVARMVRAGSVVRDGREVEALRRLERAAGVRRAIEMHVVFPGSTLRQAQGRTWGTRDGGVREGAMEPGVFGVWRAVLAWPAGISERLDDAHLEAIVAHEVCHVRRRDNLTAALHMLVEAAFWFHPLVWWLGARLIAERERACDEEVLRLGGRPQAYAEGILKVCEFCVESPLECVAGVTGADLKQRVVQIMTDRVARKLTLAKKLLLAAAALCAVAVPVLLGQAQAARRMMLALTQASEARPGAPGTMGSLRAAAHAMIAEEQTPSSGLIAEVQADVPDAAMRDVTADAAAGPAFEVASIRPTSKGNNGSMGFDLTPSGRLRIMRETVKGMIYFAYLPNMGSGLVEGGPDWTGSEEFDVNAKVEDAEVATWGKLSDAQRSDRIRPMVRTLLAERFHLKVHAESQVRPVFALVQAKGGAKLKEVQPPPPNLDPQAMEDWTRGSNQNALPGAFMMSGDTWTGNAIRIGVLMSEIAGNAGVDRLVVDETGLKGYYSFTFKPSRDKDAPILLDQVEDQLGLKLEPRKLPVKTYVIDSAEKPSVDGAEVADASIKPVALVQEKSATKPDAAIPTETSAAYVPTMAFDVASIRETKPGPEMHFVGGRFTPHTTDLKLGNVTLYWLLSIAYEVDDHQISGQPDWTGRTTFNVEAKSDAAADQRMATLDKEQEKLEQQHMMQALLAERFNLKVHWTTQEGDIYNLVLAKGGSKLQPAGSLPPSPVELKWLGDSKTPPPIHQQGDGRLGYEFYGHDCLIEDLADMISSMMGRDVVNHTGLTGKFDFHIQYHGNTPRDNRNEDPTVWPPLTDALEDQLGLKLEAGKGPVRLLVVDHVEMPSAN